MYDTIIIGGGPAGLAAAVYAARQKISFLLISKDLGGQTALSSDIENYLGFPHTNGVELSGKFEEHVEANKVETREGEEVVSLERSGTGFRVKTSAGEYEAATLLIASGKKPRKLGVPGEAELYVKGVSYCATCDAPVFANKEVAVVGGGNSAMDAALLAEKYASKVYLVNINPELMGESSMLESVARSSKITVFNSARTVAITGDSFVKGITIDIRSASQTLSVQGVFIEVGSIPSTDFDRLTEKNKYNEVQIHSEGMMTNLTSVPGIFAAGDVTDIPEKQILVAAGEGVKAALSIFQYLKKSGSADRKILS